MSREPICVPNPETGKLECFRMPVLYIPRFPWEESWPRRLAGRLVNAWAALAGRLPPAPWRALDVVLPAETRRDLTVLSTIHSLAGALSPPLRADMQATLREIGGQARPRVEAHSG